MSTRLSVMVVGLCIAMSAQAAVYKWKDANGRVHYGDQPVSGAVEVNGGAVTGAASDVPANADDQQAKQKKADECARKRDQLATYKKASKVVETDSLGNQKEFNEDERKKLVERTQQQVVENCGESADDAAAK